MIHGGTKDPYLNTHLFTSNDNKYGMCVNMPQNGAAVANAMNQKCGVKQGYMQACGSWKPCWITWKLRVPTQSGRY